MGPLLFAEAASRLDQPLGLEEERRERGQEGKGGGKLAL